MPAEACEHDGARTAGRRRGRAPRVDRGGGGRRRGSRRSPVLDLLGGQQRPPDASTQPTEPGRFGRVPPGAVLLGVGCAGRAGRRPSAARARAGARGAGPRRAAPKPDVSRPRVAGRRDRACACAAEVGRPTRSRRGCRRSRRAAATVRTGRRSRSCHESDPAARAPRSRRTSGSSPRRRRAGCRRRGSPSCRRARAAAPAAEGRHAGGCRRRPSASLVSRPRAAQGDRPPGPVRVRGGEGEQVDPGRQPCLAPESGVGRRRDGCRPTTATAPTSRAPSGSVEVDRDGVGARRRASTPRSVGEPRPPRRRCGVASATGCVAEVARRQRPPRALDLEPAVRVAAGEHLLEQPVADAPAARARRGSTGIASDRAVAVAAGSGTSSRWSSSASIGWWRKRGQLAQGERAGGRVRWREAVGQERRRLATRSSGEGPRGVEVVGGRTRTASGAVAGAPGVAEAGRG